MSKSGRPIFPLFLITAAALLVRVIFASCHYQKGDGVIVGQMATDIATGAKFPLWYYGGPYAGTFEAWLTAPLFLLTGPTFWGVPFAPIFISTLGVIAFYLLGESLHSKKAGLFVALLWAFVPFGAMFYNITPRGAYPETVCGGALLLWYATERWKGSSFKLSSGFLLGLMTGVILWSRMLIAPAVLVVMIVELWRFRLKAFSKLNLAFAIGTLVGSAPVFFNLGNILNNPAVGKPDFAGSFGRLGAYWKTLELAHLPDGPNYIVWAGKVEWILTAAALAAVLLYGTFKLMHGKLKPGSSNFGPLILYSIAFSMVYLSNTASSSYQVRYAIPMFTPVLAATGVILALLFSWSRWSSLILAFFLTGSSLTVNGIIFTELAKERDILSAEVDGLLDGFNKLGVTSVVRSDYNLITRLQYGALVRGANLKAMQSTGNLDIDITNSAERGISTGFLLTDKEVPVYKEWLRQCCGAYSETELAGYTLIHHMEGEPDIPVISIPAKLWKVSDDSTGLASRNHLKTTWKDGSTEIIITLPQTVLLAKIRVIYGGRFPETAQFFVSEDSLSWAPVTKATYPSLIYPVGSRPYQRLRWEFDREHEEWNFSPVNTRYVKLKINANNPWDIHDLFLYGTSETAPPRPVDLEIAEVVRHATTANLKILATDRRTASLLKPYAKEAGFGLVTTSFIEANPGTAKSAWDVNSSFGALVDPADADELAARLTESSISFKVVNISGRSLFLFKTDTGPMWWTGFTLLNNS